MNRTGICATALIVGSFLVAPAGAQVALVVGSVRDQHGAAIVGANVLGVGPGVHVSATTDASGTFAVRGEGLSSVRISCRFCAAQTVSVVPGQPVVAIVRRFDALIEDVPSPADLANLPYANIESAIALRPFTLLQQTTAPLPGSQLSDRGLLPASGLLVDAGIPNYDVASGASPYGSIPASYEQAVHVVPASNAYLYGDQAGAGIVSVDPFGSGDSETGFVGGDAAIRLQASSNTVKVVAGSYVSPSESRQRTDGQAAFSLSSAQTLVLNGGTSQDWESATPSSLLSGNFSFLRAAFADVQPTIDFQAAFVADRGGYVASAGGLGVGDVWSDAGFTAGARGTGAVAPFADAGARLSTGIYDESAYRAPRIAGTLTQDRLDAGVDAVGTNYDVTAGIGLFGFGYTGGTDGTSVPSYAHLATPSLQIQLFPASKWSAALEAAESFGLPTLWQQYFQNDDYDGLTYDRAALYAGTVTYTDNARLRVSVEEASQRVNGYTSGLVASSGVSISWQVAPAVALRAWTMQVTNSNGLVGPPDSYWTGTQANVNAFWLTYDNAGAVRIDAIYRRDVLDREPFEHFDASISGPIATRVRWFAGIEDLAHTRYFDAGLRLGP